MKSSRLLGYIGVNIQGSLRELVFNAEIRAGDGNTITGVAAVYNSQSEDMGFIEVLQPGCFAKSLRENPAIKSLYNHNPDLVIASRANGTLILTDTPTWLQFTATPTAEFRNTTYFASIRRGDVNQMSFMFLATIDKWSVDQNGQKIRTIIEAKLFEVSPVCFPAYTASSVAVRGKVADLARSLSLRARGPGAEGSKLTKSEKDELRAILTIIQSILQVDTGDADDDDDSTDGEATPPPDGSDVTSRGADGGTDKRSAIPYKKEALAPVDTKWDAGKVEDALDVDGLKRACAWYDQTAPKVKSSYKLPHHDSDFRTVWHGVSAAMGALMGSQGGAKIPDGDRKAVYDHLAKHYAEFQKTPPDFERASALTDQERRRLDAMRLFILQHES